MKKNISPKTQLLIRNLETQNITLRRVLRFRFGKDSSEPLMKAYREFLLTFGYRLELQTIKGGDESLVQVWIPVKMW